MKCSVSCESCRFQHFGYPDFQTNSHSGADSSHTGPLDYYYRASLKSATSLSSDLPPKKNQLNQISAFSAILLNKLLKILHTFTQVHRNTPSHGQNFPFNTYKFTQVLAQLANVSRFPGSTNQTRARANAARSRSAAQRSFAPRSRD